MSTQTRPTIGIGLIGTGFMGRCHALAFRQAPAIFSHLPPLRLAVLADNDDEAAVRAATAFGFAKATTDWHGLIDDPDVDLVAITTPNYLHQEMAMAAIDAGKAVYCEKPLALDAAGAKAMTHAAETAGVKTLVGYNSLHNPVIGLAAEIVASGELGEPVHFRGRHAEDFLADPDAPHSWRSVKATAGAGVIADLGSHIISLARRLVGEIDAVQADVRTVVGDRPRLGDPERRAPVEVDDQAQMLVRFKNGASGSLEASGLAIGRKMSLTFELTGSKGTLVFDQERMNELRLCTASTTASREGFKTILCGPAHPPYGAFCPAPGHGLGFNDLKVIEVAHLIDGIAEGRDLDPDFRAAWQIAEVVDAALASASSGSWTDVAEIANR